ncbi:unnamed protein product [Rotaria socialis]|uniref:Uncharacterized protein n=1 Tax=Rotaria socialis TaxID=392032 RepID=A0A817YCR9_9BILA|nr:unnamed protein product [Rotaria socialis]CAF3346088.1 unnamed protein product [Rotaria socialis]CAF3378839.1 unnamed protein product [Rotaria socialis]CAF3506233.1 unnamed protein product [Rotaria socialis]CAF4156275.1 unnamed protein product [Rotaria socialis]
MEEMIRKKLGNGWKSAIINGTKPPVKLCLRKTFKWLLTTNQPNDSTTTTKLHTPLVKRDTPFKPLRQRLSGKIKEDTVYDLKMLYDRSINDDQTDDHQMNDNRDNDIL